MLSRYAAWLVLAAVCFKVSRQSQARHEPTAEELELERDAMDGAANRDDDDDYTTFRDDQLQALHTMMDDDRDGKVSLKEMLRFSEISLRSIATQDIHNILDDVDSSKDGLVSLEEYLAQFGDAAYEHEDSNEMDKRKNLHHAKFKVCDENGDALLTKDELVGLYYPEVHHGVLDIMVQHSMKQKDRDGNGRLNLTEFWEVDGMEDELTLQEKDDFNKLDRDGDKMIDRTELMAWDSGRHHTEDAMNTIIRLADKDRDQHITYEELQSARRHLERSDAGLHLSDWVSHHEL